MSKKIRPISVEKFPDISTNCLGFAVGSLENIEQSKKDYNLDETLPIGDAFISWLEQHDFQVPRQISSLDEAQPSEYVFKIIGFKTYNYRQFGVNIPIYDFHVIRREPNGIWVHKNGWYCEPSIVSEEDWANFEEDFGAEYALFALDTSSDEER